MKCLCVLPFPLLLTKHLFEGNSNQADKRNQTSVDFIHCGNAPGTVGWHVYPPNAIDGAITVSSELPRMATMAGG